MPGNENGSKLRRIANQKWTQNGFLQNDDTREFHMPRRENRNYKVYLSARSRVQVDSRDHDVGVARVRVDQHLL